MSNNILRKGKPCNHPGCLNHISHPCEGCGQPFNIYRDTWAKEINQFKLAEAEEYFEESCKNIIKPAV